MKAYSIFDDFTQEATDILKLCLGLEQGISAGYPYLNDGFLR